MWTGVWKVDKILAHRWNENGFEFLTRKRVAAQVCAAKTQCRAHVHCLTIEALTLRGLASTAYEVYSTVLQVGDI
ncbi:hypothetical protein AB1Y20_023086 [Prymnesium parvum]|uniref:Uncharacterized protein n=1 Tax=Prymnesium parvum TaxID=97485 RepID=A0AB34JEE6_PRYPA